MTDGPLKEYEIALQTTWEGDKFTVAFSATLHSQKACDMLIKTLEILKSEWSAIGEKANDE